MASYIASFNTQSIIAPAAARYAPMRGSAFGSGIAPPETEVQLAETVGLSACNLSVTVKTNGLNTGSSTVRTRKNGANANLTISFNALTTGTFSDLVNSDFAVAGDSFNFSSVIGGVSGTTTYAVALAINRGTTTDDKAWHVNFNATVASTTNYIPICGGWTPTTTETDAQALIRTAATASALSVYVNTNGRATATTVTSRKGAAPGALTLSIGGSGTGAFSDTTNSEALVSGNLYNVAMTTGTGAGTLALRTVNVHMVYSGTSYDIFGGCSVAGINFGDVSRFAAPFGCTSAAVSAANEALGVSVVTLPVTMSRFRFYVNSSTTTGTMTGRVRKSGANGNQTFSIGAAATGSFEDTTNSDTFVYSDTLCYNIGAASTGGANGVMFGGTFQDTYSPPSMTGLSDITGVSTVTF